MVVSLRLAIFHCADVGLLSLCVCMMPLRGDVSEVLQVERLRDPNQSAFSLNGYNTGPTLSCFRF